jgi:hypothetical protein
MKQFADPKVSVNLVVEYELVQVAHELAESPLLQRKVHYC